MKQKRLLFTVLFSIFGFVALHIPLFQIQGAKAAFTLFDFMAPIAGSFLGIIPGIISVLAVQTVNTVVSGNFGDTTAMIRLFPMLFGVWYFAKKDRRALFVPILAMILFNLHPIGRTTLPYSLYWLIPVACHFFHKRFLFARALGATFTVHAVGSTAWLYVFNLPREVWIGLIPQVAIERFAMAVGITVFYYLFVNILYILTSKNLITLPFQVEKRYVLGFLR